MPYTLSTAGDLATVYGSAGALNADLISQQDTSAFSVALIQITGTFVGTITFQGTNEDAVSASNWNAMVGINIATGVVASTATTTGLYLVPLTCKLFRARMTAYTSGTANSINIFSYEDIPFIEAGNQVVSGTVTLGAGSANVGFVVPAATTGSTGSILASRITGAAASGVIKATSGRIYGYSLVNTNAAVRFLQLYNKATAGIPGTDTPAFTIPIPANGSVTYSDIFGYNNSTGISWAITTDAAGATAGAATDIVGSFLYV